MGKDGSRGRIEKVSMRAEAKKSTGKLRAVHIAKEIAYLALGVALLAVCAWITVPIAAIPVTLQTFAVAFLGVLFGPIRGTVATLVYFFMGLIGIPVFSGFGAGAAALLGPTGGYLIGFLFEVAVGGLFSLIRVKNQIAKTALCYLGMLLGLALLYFFGTLWFITVYSGGGSIGVGAALMLCVVPYVLPDGVKLFLAAALGVKLKPYLKSDIKKQKNPQ